MKWLAISCILLYPELAVSFYPELENCRIASPGKNLQELSAASVGKPKAMKAGNGLPFHDLQFLKIPTQRKNSTIR